MSPWLSCALADARGRELRGETVRPQARESKHEAAWSWAGEIRREAHRSRTGPTGPGARPARGAVRRSRVRRRVGFALVEAGLHLLATESRN